MRKLYTSLAAIVAGLPTATQAGPPAERESISASAINEELFLTVEMFDEFFGGSFVQIQLTKFPNETLFCFGRVEAPSNIVQIAGSAKQGSATANAMLDAFECIVGDRPDSVSLSCEHDDVFYFSSVGKNTIINQGHRATLHGTHKRASAACLIELNGDVYNSAFASMEADREVRNEVINEVINE